MSPWLASALAWGRSKLDVPCTLSSSERSEGLFVVVTFVVVFCFSFFGDVVLVKLNPDKIPLPTALICRSDCMVREASAQLHL